MGSEPDAAGRDADAQSRWMESASVGDSVDLSLDNVEDSDGEEPAVQRAEEEEEEDGGEEEDNATVAATDDAGFDQHSLAPAPSVAAALAVAPVSVQAPPFAAVHRSWAVFDAQLKGYSHSTYQLYVVRTTTSVQRRNIRIAELATTTSGSASGGAAGSSNVDADDGAEDANEEDDDEEEGEEEEEEEEPAPRASDHAERLLIPAHLKWYSKTMMCTHGWKDRNRGTGKRATTMVRSTGCPVKMCITVQHTNEARADDDEDDDGWRVVVTKHMRTHNHPLSKELYLFYTENRRIYDPELLALVGGNSPSGAALSADFYGAFGDDDEDHALGATSGHGQEDPLATSIAPMAPKAFNSWEQFHECLGDYSLSTQQHFRIRSTISTQAKNAKTLEQGTKAGKSAEEVSELLVPEPLKWYSKLLICNHGWKRKSRSKMARFQRQSVVEEWNDPSPNACPAMVMARLQRDIHDKWRIVINRQVTNHNHALYALDSADANHEVQIVDGTASELEASSAAVALMNPALTAPPSETTEDDQNEEFVNAAVRHLSDLQLPPPSEASTEQDDSQRALLQSATAETLEPPTQPATELHSIPRPMTVVTEVVVRVAKLQTIHQSWEAFHSCLQQYSESTYQSYRTRTTSSVAGRNQKIMEMRATNENSSGVLSLAAEGGSAERDGVGSETRLIPEHYKWYSKTLTCTHGWKERRRGSGKRTIHIVRSTLCPVKICATLQYLEPDSSNSGEVGWRVVVTKHIIDHNHNLSKELFQHYRDNRRIYDPALLAISQANAVDATSTGSASSQPLAAPLAPASTNQVSDNVGPASITDEQHTLLASGAPVSFEQAQAFNAHHALPESAYAVPNPVNPNQQVFLMANGTTLVSFTTIPVPTSTLLHSATAPTLSASTSAAMHQMFGSGSMFPNAPYSSMQAPDFSGEVAQGLSATSIMCQVHGHSTSLEASSSASGECTCLRIPVVHQFTPSTTAPPSGDDSTSRLGKRRGRSAEDQQANVASASKRPRTQREEDAVDPHNRLNEFSSGLVAGAAPTVVEGIDTSSTTSPAPIWSPENPAQVEPMTESDGTVIWRAPRLKRRHENWAEFTDHLNAYSQSTLQLYRVRTTSSIAARNIRIYQQLQQMQEDGGPGVHPDQGELVPHLVPASYEWYSKTYVCTHGWKERRRGKGQRVSHSLRSTECPVKLCVTLQRDPHDTENWNVVVTKQVLNHNHEISMSVFQGYSENRRIKDPQLLAQAEQMWREGQPRRKVFEFLKGATKTNIVMKDIHNLVQRWQQQQPSHETSTVTATAMASEANALGHPQHAPSSGRGAQSELDLMI